MQSETIPYLPGAVATEAQVNAFISDLAARLAIERGASDVTACFVCMFTGVLGVQKRWSITVGREEGSGATIAEAVRQIENLSSRQAVAERVALLRKQADELEKLSSDSTQ